jgi:hypothetical protein
MAADTCALFGLPSIPQHDYKDKRSFLSVLDTATRLFESDTGQSQYILFHGVTQQLYDQDFEEFHGIDSFIPSLALILYKMTTRTHEAVSGEFTKMLNEKLMHMGRLHKALIEIGGAEVRGETRAKRPGKSYVPLQHPNRKWPTLVVEGGFCEDLRHLQSDARWWLSESEGKAHTVIIMAHSRTRNELTIEKWVYDQGPTRQYHTMVLETPNGAQATNRNPLTIGFNGLLLRDPQGPPEQDIDFGTHDWEDIATIVWKWQHVDESGGYSQEEF